MGARPLLRLTSGSLRPASVCGRGCRVQAVRTSLISCDGHRRVALRVADPVKDLRRLRALERLRLHVGVLVDLDRGSPRQRASPRAPAITAPRSAASRRASGNRASPRRSCTSSSRRRDGSPTRNGGTPSRIADPALVELEQLDQRHVARVDLRRLPVDPALEDGGLADRDEPGVDPLRFELGGFVGADDVFVLQDARRDAAAGGEVRPVAGQDFGGDERRLGLPRAGRARGRRRPSPE